MKAWNERDPVIEAAFRICAQVQEHEKLRRLELVELPQNIRGVVDEIKTVCHPYIAAIRHLKICALCCEGGVDLCEEGQAIEKLLEQAGRLAAMENGRAN